MICNGVSGQRRKRASSIFCFMLALSSMWSSIADLLSVAAAALWKPTPRPDTCVPHSLVTSKVHGLVLRVCLDTYLPAGPPLVVVPHFSRGEQGSLANARGQSWFRQMAAAATPLHVHGTSGAHRRRTSATFTLPRLRLHLQEVQETGEVQGSLATGERLHRGPPVP